MEKFVATFKEGVEAGNTGRNMSVTFVVDDIAKWNDLAVAQAVVKLQAKTRKKVQGWLFADLNGTEVKVSDLMARTATALTPQSAVKVFSNQDIATKIEMLYDLGMNTDGIEQFFTHQKEKGGVTEQQYNEAIELLAEAD